jgi:dihydrofolate reductase
VADGIESAIKQAKAVAGDKDVVLSGGANIAQQCLKAGLLDEMHLHLVPVLLCQGLRLFDHVGMEQIEMEITQAIAGTGVTHLIYRFVKP